MTGLFETMLAFRGRIVQFDEHVERMARSCRELGLEPLDEGAFRDAALASVWEAEHALRVVYEDGTLSATAFDIPAPTRSRRTYGRATTLPAAMARPLPRYKRVPDDLDWRGVIPPRSDEALFVTPEGHILEGTSTNVFAVRDDVLITAPDGVLPGIVRAWVLARGLRVEERPPTVDDLRGGGFFTGSLTTLAPIRTLDGEACAPPGETYTELARLYDEMFRRRVTLHPS
ncbi:MAG TPA: aminotransferase class IV [Thermoanaerobaculia bacterium]|nr:aminotransferase class IV [Thermoanaerobaculia bacterium]